MKKILSKSIVLIGLMGSGKSVIGKRLSEKIGVPLSDTDNIVEERSGNKVYRIFKEYGEKYFRNLEEKVVASVLDGRPHIISTGGGSILSIKTRQLIKLKSFSIWVKCDENIISRRILKQERRPLLENKKIVDELIEKNRERVRYYNIADMYILNENANLERTIQSLIEELFIRKVLV